MISLAVLGSTGSIGTQTMDVVRKNPGLFRVKALACLSNIDLLESQARECKPEMVAVFDESAANLLRERLRDTEIPVYSGMEGLLTLAAWPGTDRVVTALVGMIGIEPTVAAVKAGKDIALANKETLVTAGQIIMPLAKERGVSVLPVDSEHSAIFQALQGRAGSKIRRLLLTASGGPFYGKSLSELREVTAADALAHPTWKMGQKITIDSATLVNKGLELIEAVRLFDVAPEQVEVIIHPQSILHSAVEYEDGSIIAQLGPSDMRIPIQFALTYPEHLPSPAEPLRFEDLIDLQMQTQTDETPLRGIALARRAIAAGGTMPTVFNAANEWANAAFLAGRIPFLSIFDVIEKEMEQHRVKTDPGIEDILELQREVEAKLEEEAAC